MSSNVTVVDKQGINPKRQKDLKRVTNVAEKLSKVIEDLPRSTDMVAGYVLAFNKGDRTAGGNAFAKFLTGHRPATFEYLDSGDAKISANGDGVRVELGDFEAHIEMPSHVEAFTHYLLTGYYPSLIKS